MTPALGVSVALDQRGRKAVEELVGDRFMSRLFGQDPTLWGPAAESEAANRLGWTLLSEHLDAVVVEAAALRHRLHNEQIDRVLLCGMGGSSLAPEVICASQQVPLDVLDSSDPDQIRRAFASDMHRTVCVIASKSGSTVETASQHAALHSAFLAAGLDPADHIVVITDPGSPLERSARDAGGAVFLGDPHVGGRFSALTAFGLVPSVLAGADAALLLSQARTALAELARDDVDNPAILLGAALAADPAITAFLLDAHPTLDGLPDWIEQLVAESTGKDGFGLLPVIGHPTSPPVSFTDAVRVAVRPLDASPDASLDASLGASEPPAEVIAQGELGAQFLLWEAATAVMGRLLGVNPFDQPDVESAKLAARAALASSADAATASFVEGAVEVYGDPAILAGCVTLDDALNSLAAALPSAGYLAVCAYLDRRDDSPIPPASTRLMERLGRPVTFGWGPRFLHSTGQLHKGGPNTGVFLQLTGTPNGGDLEVPGAGYSFGKLIAAQASGDAAVLRDRARTVLRMNLTDRTAGIVQVVAALDRLGR
jgi:glucose-6-phosphate isomerase